jgi:hypothetical protein
MSEERAACRSPRRRSLGHEYDQLREQGGVHRVALPDGSHAWSVTGYDQVSRALAHPELSLDKRHAHGWSGFGGRGGHPDAKAASPRSGEAGAGPVVAIVVSHPWPRRTAGHLVEQHAVANLTAGPA